MKASSIIRSPRQLAISLRDARIAKGLTQTALAQQTGLGRPWINQLEQGKIENASLSRILALCNALEVTFTVSYEVPPPTQLIIRIRDGIAAQSTRILSWFATANGGNARYCYSRFL